MLRSLRIQNFRSFEDTDIVELRKLNVLIGANNAGKTSFLSAVELFLRSTTGGGLRGPLAFETMPMFASFDSVLRRHWSKQAQRPHTFQFRYDWDTGGARASSDFVCSGHPKDNTAYVSKAVYRLGERTIDVEAKDHAGRPGSYEIKRNGKKVVDESPFFHRLFPISIIRSSPSLIPWFERGQFSGLEVVRPYRPVPRSFYVLDDPGLGSDDRELLTFLIGIWKATDTRSKHIQSRIAKSLKTLNLALNFDVTQRVGRLGPKVIEIRVSPTMRRQRVTIADAGFGLSQALPLLVYDARLDNGALIAYQPEVHLHPFAQSRLADIFAQSIARGNQVFVETHSQDLVLRLQLLLAKRELSPDDVRVFCVESKQGRSEITAVDFNAKGAPQIPWPAGFLDTSLKVARELAESRRSSAS